MIKEHAIRVKKIPKADISNFSSINPNKMVGKHNKTAQMVNFRYFGFIGQLLFIKIKFKAVVITYMNA